MANSLSIRKLIVEKYRPTSLETYVFQNKETEKLVRKWVDEKEFPNVMLSGSSGTGKSTLVRILSTLEGIDQADVKRVNGSSTNGIGFIRDELEPWLKRSSYGKFKVVVVEECLHEDETVRIGTIENWDAVRIGDLDKDTTYNIVSVDMTTGKLFNDTGEVISDKNDEVYEIELTDGRVVRVTENHPMLVMTADGTIVERTISGGLDVGDMVVSVL